MDLLLFGYAEDVLDDPDRLCRVDFPVVDQLEIAGVAVFAGSLGILSA